MRRATRRFLVLVQPSVLWRSKTANTYIIKLAAADDGVTRELGDLVVIPYDIPEKWIAAYCPEANVLIPVRHYAKESKVPAAKSVPVRIALQHAAP